MQNMRLFRYANNYTIDELMYRRVCLVDDARMNVYQ